MPWHIDCVVNLVQLITVASLSHLASTFVYSIMGMIQHVAWVVLITTSYYSNYFLKLVSDKWLKYFVLLLVTTGINYISRLFSNQKA